MDAAAISVLMAMHTQKIDAPPSDMIMLPEIAPMTICMALPIPLALPLCWPLPCNDIVMAFATRMPWLNPISDSKNDNKAGDNIAEASKAQMIGSTIKVIQEPNNTHPPRDRRGP